MLLFIARVRSRSLYSTRSLPPGAPPTSPSIVKNIRNEQQTQLYRALRPGVVRVGRPRVISRRPRVGGADAVGQGRQNSLRRAEREQRPANEEREPGTDTRRLVRKARAYRRADEGVAATSPQPPPRHRPAPLPPEACLLSASWQMHAYLASFPEACSSSLGAVGRLPSCLASSRITSPPGCLASSPPQGAAAPVSRRFLSLFLISITFLMRPGRS